MSGTGLCMCDCHDRPDEPCDCGGHPHDHADRAVATERERIRRGSAVMGTAHGLAYVVPADLLDGPDQLWQPS